MQKQIYKGLYFEVDTTHGTEIVPCDVVNRTIAVDVSALLDYLNGNPLDNDEVIEVKEGYLARLTLPGYLDCTDWGVYESFKSADEALEDMFGEGLKPGDYQ